LAFWNYNNKGPKLAISWWIAWTFFWGSALFTLGSAAALSHKVLGTFHVMHRALLERMLWGSTYLLCLLSKTQVYTWS